MAGTGANSVPLSHLHPILAAKLAAGGGVQGSSGGAIPLPGAVSSSTDKLERAKRAASALFPCECVLTRVCACPVYICNHIAALNAFRKVLGNFISLVCLPLILRLSPCLASLITYGPSSCNLYLLCPSSSPALTAKKKRSRWGAEEDKTIIPGVPAVLPSNMSENQQTIYLCESSPWPTCVSPLPRPTCGGD